MAIPNSYPLSISLGWQPSAPRAWRGRHQGWGCSRCASRGVGQSVPHMKLASLRGYYWKSLCNLFDLPLNFKEVALRSKSGLPLPNWQHCMWYHDFHRIYIFWNFWLIYKCCDTICPDSVLSWFSAECWTVEWSCGATLARARTRHSPPLSWARQWRGAAPVRDTTHYLTQDWNCFAADKLTQADHSIQYSIEQNFKSKMGSWGWQVED